MRVASRVVTVTLDQDRVIASGETITVHYILVANSTKQAAEVCVQDIAGNREAIIVCPPQDSKPIEVDWIADAGLQFDGIGSAEVSVTVWHSSGGA